MLQQKKKIMAIILMVTMTGTMVTPMGIFAQVMDKVPGIQRKALASGSNADFASDSDAEEKEHEAVSNATLSNTLPYTLEEGSYEYQDGRYTFEAEFFYTGAEPAADGQAANLQPHTQIKVPLEEVAGLAEGQYLVEIMYAGNGQTLKAASGGLTGMIVCADTGFDWNQKTVAAGDALLTFNGTGFLTVEAISDGKYGWVDWIRLTPVRGVLLKAKDFVNPADQLTGEENSCANMDPGVRLEIPIEGNFTGAHYELQMWTCGNGREYEIRINGEKAGSYQTESSDFGNASLHEDGRQGRFRLHAGDELVITAPEGSYGWVKELLLWELPERFWEQDLDTGIIVESEEDTSLPKGTKLKVTQVRDKVSDEWFREQGLRAVYYKIQLKRPSGSVFRFREDMESGLLIEIPLPPGFAGGDDSTDIYYISDGVPESLHGTWSDTGKSCRAQMEPPENQGGVYALTTKKGVFRYEAEEHYDAVTDGGHAANFEESNGNTLSVKLEKSGGFSSGIYNLLLRYCGGGDKELLVLVNGKAAGTIDVPYAGWGDYQIQAAKTALPLTAGDEVTVRTPDGQYHWVDYLELKEAEPFYSEVQGITATAPVGALPYGAVMAIEDAYEGPEAERMERKLTGADRMRIFRLYFYLDDPNHPLTPSGPVAISMDFPDGYNPDKFCLYHVSGEGQGMRGTKVPCTLDGGEINFGLSGETGVFVLANNASYVPADSDNESIYSRRGATRANGEPSGSGVQLRTRTVDGRYLYEGEAYYKVQGESLTADLQPGAQLTFRLSDNPEFAVGTYRLVVRSNGNRQRFTIKVNHEPVGTISRFGTGFGMASMTEDAMAGTLVLHPSDLLTVEAEGGQNFGWVDYVALEHPENKTGEKDLQASDFRQEGESKRAASVTYRAADYYDKKADNDSFADLQPGGTIRFQAGDHPDFREGFYRIAVTSNGNRTRLLVKKNGSTLGSIVRVHENGFDRTDMTRNLLGRTFWLAAEDVITIEAPGSDPEQGPWGWVGDMELIPPPAATGAEKEEYRYEGEDYYQASPYSPAADLQAGEAIHIPLSDDPDFRAGSYRLSVLSNGTRQLFLVWVNGRQVGTISKAAADYSDIDYSQDYMGESLALSPGDVLTLCGQEGDYFGWVNYILLEKEN